MVVYIIAIIGNMIPVPIIFFLPAGAGMGGKPVIGKFHLLLESAAAGGEAEGRRAGRGSPRALLLFAGIPAAAPVLTGTAGRQLCWDMD